MAPITRSSALVPGGNSLHPAMAREASWQYIASDLASERAVSEEPASSYEGDMVSGVDDEGNEERQAQYEDPEDHEDFLHPLREAANRVGREVERFAEVLDEYNPLKATEKEEKHEMAIEVIEMYYRIALETLERLREQHAAEKRRKDGLSWRKKMRGFKIAQDEDEMDLEDENQYGDPQTTLADLERWEDEAQTWDLLRRLVHLRYPAPGSTDNALNSLSRHKVLHQYSTEREVWENFLEQDGVAFERKTVLQWLQDTAEESGEEIDVLVHDLQQNAERGDIIAHGWLHTKAAIKKQKRIHVWPQALDSASAEIQKVHLNSSGTEPLITQLDPDAMTRQNRKLETQDVHFERAIWLGCYEMLRRGRSPEQIREWCIDRTEVWRAVSMGGFPDQRPEEDDEAADLASISLWRRMCFSLARNGGGDEYERAVYGILSGDISSVEGVCRSWNDFVFVHYNALLRTQFDNYLQKVHPQQSVAGQAGVFDAVQFHGDPKTAAKRLVKTLKTERRISAETLQPMKMLQGVLIGDQFDSFIYQQGLALEKFANAKAPSNLFPVTDEQPENDLDEYVHMNDHENLRVFTHILLILTNLGLDLGGAYRQSVVENVIVSYISFLRLAGKEELIPLYCAQLSGTRRYATLCRNLIDVTDHEQRVTQIQLMRDLGLDVQEFVKFQSRYLFADHPDDTDGYPATNNFKLLENGPTGRKVKSDFFGDDPEKVERLDMLFIRSLEWYLLIDGLWSETFAVGTMLYLRFFKHMHLTAARMLASKVSSSHIARSKTGAILGESLDLVNLESELEDEELTVSLDGSEDLKKYLKKHLLAEAKSFRELEALTETLDNIETVISMTDLLQEKSLTEWQKGWRQQLGRNVQPMKNTMQPLLKGWLLTSQEEAEEEQFKLLREAYLPETILAYISTLQLAGEILTRELLMECMDLSALIAAEDSDLLELFSSTGRMQELIEAFAFAGKSLVILTSARSNSGSRSKKLRLRGWTPELFSVS